uniref:hypothetical protein n=1 Tax=Bacteroides uniformis TaxID=820 RepID=UPI003FEEE664
STDIGYKKKKRLAKSGKDTFHYFRKGLTVGKHASPSGGTPFTPRETPFTIGGKGLYNMG